jgi:hypothetical protein
MSSRIDEILNKINEYRLKLTELWEIKGRTDQDILALSQEMDRLINEYNHLKLNKQ